MLKRLLLAADKTTPIPKFDPPLPEIVLPFTWFRSELMITMPNRLFPLTVIPFTWAFIVVGAATQSRMPVRKPVRVPPLTCKPVTRVQEARPRSLAVEVWMPNPDPGPVKVWPLKLIWTLLASTCMPKAVQV